MYIILSITTFGSYQVHIAFFFIALFRVFFHYILVLCDSYTFFSALSDFIFCPNKVLMRSITFFFCVLNFVCVCDEALDVLT